MPDHLAFSSLPADPCGTLRDNSTTSTEVAARDQGPEICGGRPAMEGAVIELRVRNHPGVMSHITGLFARRAFNLEAILCAPNPDDSGASSRMLLLVAEQPRLRQVELQLAKLHDVLSVRHRRDIARDFFTQLVAALPAGEVTAPAVVR